MGFLFLVKGPHSGTNGFGILNFFNSFFWFKKEIYPVGEPGFKKNSSSSFFPRGPDSGFFNPGAFGFKNFLGGFKGQIKVASRGSGKNPGKFMNRGG